MADLAEVYAATRRDLAAFVSSLADDELERPVPATPEWSIRDVVAHLAGVAQCVAAGDFPREFFVAIGSEAGVRAINEWTGRQVETRRGPRLQDLLDEWEGATAAIAPMMRGDVPWPEGVIPVAAHVLTTDLAVHQQDVYGAVGLVKDRDAAPIRIGFATYAAGADLRLKASGGPALRFVTERKEVVAGDGDPVATVRGTHYELFRALSGRRSPDQLRAYEWEGDPEPFLELFYPYGVREQALVE
ncbi:MAG TPA: maleylpyruvate isomerase family mycothiol-dependent enzyme [Actinomycetota bacterium]|nr:maleylpyruvate isomerase family mycothiol-dependent enzyme [Actinomycetota bacterium]